MDKKVQDPSIRPPAIARWKDLEKLNDCVVSSVESGPSAAMLHNDEALNILPTVM